MVCSRCGQTGHNIRTCASVEPPSTPENINAPSPPQAPLDIRHEDPNNPYNYIDDDGNIISGLENDERVARNLQQSFIEEVNSTYQHIDILNKTDYEVHAYFVASGLDQRQSEKDIKYMGYIEVFKGRKFKIQKDSKIIITKSFYGTEKYISDVVPDDILQIVYIKSEVKNIYVKDRKSDIMKWKTAALKSQFLLQQIIKFGGMKCGNDTIEGLLDLVQDLPFPKYDECDLEHAGVPSKLTNIS